MARIEPIPWNDLPDETRAMMEAGTASGMYTTTVPMQMIAYSTAAMTAMHRSYEATFRKGVLEPRLVELLRLHSAQTAMCAPCSTSRKDDSISDDDVACLVSPDASRFAPREWAALQFFDQLAGDHHAIDDDTFRSLAEVFTRPRSSRWPTCAPASRVGRCTAGCSHGCRSVAGIWRPSGSSPSSQSISRLPATGRHLCSRRAGW